MKKILAIILTVAMATTLLCSTAMAASVAPVYWDLEIELRKADPDNVVKDGVIGENEYEKIDVNNDLLWLNYNTVIEDGFGKILENSAKVRESLEYYFSWDEVNGLNFAVRYIPLEVKNDFTPDADGEYVVSNPFGAIMFNAYYKDDPKYTPEGKNNGCLVYSWATQNTDTKDLITGVYQNGYKENYTVDNICIVYDESTGYVTYEWSVPLDALTQEPTVGGEFYIVIAAAFGQGKNGQSWGACEKNHFSLNLGQWGFYMGQETCTGGQATVVKISDVAVGYVEPTPTPTPEPTPTPDPATPTPAAEEPAESNNTVDIVIMIVEAVVIIALLAALVIKKKKQ